MTHKRSGKYACVEERPLVDGFLLGLPKCGTTWLAGVLSQNPSVDFSSPKEPNILASHHGTFGRDTSDPDLDEYGRAFSGNGFRVDGSVHAFSCPLAPNRVLQINSGARFVICLREPIERAFSHWKMVRDNMADRMHGADWSDFETAWGDQRLKARSKKKFFPSLGRLAKNLEIFRDRADDRYYKSTVSGHHVSELPSLLTAYRPSGQQEQHRATMY